MKPIDDLFTEIAREHLDSLDFHDVALWGVKDALRAAYEAGAGSMIAGSRPAAAAHHTPGPWHYEVSENCPDVWQITADACEWPLAEVPRQPDEDGNDSPEAEANVCLMTASPRLYAACRMVVDRWERGDLAEAARACSAAIEEAEKAECHRHGTRKDFKAKPSPLPPDPDGMNFDRASWADRAISAFRDATGTDREDALSDLLADLMHWADRAGYGFDEAFDRARGHYGAETAGE